MLTYANFPGAHGAAGDGAAETTGGVLGKEGMSSAASVLGGKKGVSLSVCHFAIMCVPITPLSRCVTQ